MYVQLWKYLNEFFLECEMFWIKFVEKIKTHFVAINGFPKPCLFWDNVEKYIKARHATDDNLV